MKLVTQLRLALLLMLLLGLCGAALQLWNANQSRTHIKRINLSHTIYEGYLSLESHTYQLFKQYGDAIIIGDVNQRASKNALIDQISGDIKSIRSLLATKAELVGPEAVDNRSTLDTIEKTVSDLINRLDQFSPTGSGELSSDWERLSNLLNDQIDGDFRELIRSALADELVDVERTGDIVDRAIVLQQWVTLLFAITAIVAALLVVTMLSYRLTKPINTLVSGVRQFGEGHHSFRISLPGRDELSEIASSFNVMASKVEEKNQTLASEKEWLQQAVEERTQQLSVMVEDLKRIDTSRKNMIADVSHELRTPLTIIKGEADIALRGEVKDVSVYCDALERTREAANHTARLVDDLLFVARTEAGEIRLSPTDIDLCVVAREAHSTFGSDADLSIDTAMALTKGDAGRIRQALIVLLENARHHGGSKIQLRLGNTAGGYYFSVEDDGPGMSDEEKSQAFERFYRGSNAAERYGDGAGLGLPVAQSIARAHGGTITLRDRPAGGLIAALWLPGKLKTEQNDAGLPNLGSVA
jgi:signal transduction histidine kinase